MALTKIRKIITVIEETHEEAGKKIKPATRRAAAIAVIKNPFAGIYEQNLEPLIIMGEELGELLGQACLAALGIAPETCESFGKAALVGENGEIEHAAAILHPNLGKTLRKAIGKGAAIVPSNKKRGAMGRPLDVPLGHKDAAYVRSHFDGMEVMVNDAPRADEILVAIALTDSGRPLPRVGGLTDDEVEGVDGLK